MSLNEQNPQEDGHGNIIFPDTSRCFSHNNYMTSMKCPVCSIRGDCFLATRKRIREEAESKPLPEKEGGNPPPVVPPSTMVTAPKKREEVHQ
jgi:hypothetical protein